MEKGTIVKIVDGSYMFTVENGIITSFPSNRNNPHSCIGWCRDEFEVIDGDFRNIDNEFKVFYSGRDNGIRIDTIIKNKKTGEIWYCNSDISLRVVDNQSYNRTQIPEYTMDELQRRIGHKFKIVK